VRSIGDPRTVATNSDRVLIELSRDEALILFEWLHRCGVEDQASRLEHDAERVALWNLAALLERGLAEPFKQNYPTLLGAARDRLAGDHQT
jgi:hypothetical protein